MSNFFFITTVLTSCSFVEHTVTFLVMGVSTVGYVLLAFKAIHEKRKVVFAVKEVDCAAEILIHICRAVSLRNVLCNCNWDIVVLCYGYLAGLAYQAGVG
jgi:hypothetical protein